MPTRTRRSIRPTARWVGCCLARERACRRLARAPGERREVTVVAPRRVVPVDPEPVHVTAGGLREREPARRRMPYVVEVDRLVRLGSGDTLDRDVEHARNRDRAPHPGHLEFDRL